jgi:hypothetical protein
MQIERLLAVPLHQAMLTVPLVETEQTGGIDQEHRTAQ